jgi:hypothetical protein
MAPDERAVDALHLARLDLAREIAMRLFGARDEKKPRGSLVETMDDPGALFPVRGGKGAIAMEERVDQRAGAVAYRRMHHHAGGLVDHGDRVVLVDDVEGDRLGSEYGRLAAGAGHFDAVAGAHAAACARGGVVHADMPGVDQMLHGGTREGALDFGEVAVEPLTRPGLRHEMDLRNEGRRRARIARDSRQAGALRW